MRGASSGFLRRRGALRRLIGRAGADAGGAAAIEFSFFVPLLATMVIAGSDIGMAVYRKIQVEAAAQAGAEWAIRNGFDANAIAGAVTGATAAAVQASPPPARFCGCPSGTAVVAASCGSSCPGGATAGTYATVSATLNYATTVNYGICPERYDIVAQSTVRLQ